MLQESSFQVWNQKRITCVNYQKELAVKNEHMKVWTDPNRRKSWKNKWIFFRAELKEESENNVRIRNHGILNPQFSNLQFANQVQSKDQTV